MNRWLFLDMNAFFASVEQSERPELRGKPILIAPIMAESTCAIAASYEAKAKGVKTGTGVREAKLLCPDIMIVAARPDVYVQYHHRIMDVLQRFFVEPNPLSVDEMACRVSRMYPTREAEEKLAHSVKAALHTETGLRCSVGVADNIFLAKVASDMQKPDGLTLLDSSNVKERLFALKLTDLPGIARAMLARLLAHNITTVQELWEADEAALRRAWGSVVGARWYYMLRGSTTCDYVPNTVVPRKSVGQSHVLPPEFRTREGVIQIACRLTERALKRMREYEMRAASVQLQVEYRCLQGEEGYCWRERSPRHIHASDDISWMRIILPLLHKLPLTRFRHQPMQVAVTFTDLLSSKDCTLSLFPEHHASEELSRVADILNEKGLNVHPGSTFWMQEQAPKRIPFGPPR